MGIDNASQPRFIVDIRGLVSAPIAGRGTRMSKINMGLLSAVAQGLDEALDGAREAAMAATSTPIVNFAASKELHSAHAAIKMIGLEGAARACRDFERLAEAIAEGRAELSSAKPALISGIGALRSALADARKGRAGASGDLASARGAALAALGEPAGEWQDLFFPEMDPHWSFAGPGLPAREAAAAAGDGRKKFQEALVSWMKSEPLSGSAESASKEMGAAIDIFALIDGRKPFGLFWIAAKGLVEMAAKAGLDPKDPQARASMAVVDAEIKRLAAGADAPAEGSLKSILFQLAQSQAPAAGAWREAVDLFKVAERWGSSASAPEAVALTLELVERCGEELADMLEGGGPLKFGLACSLLADKMDSRAIPSGKKLADALSFVAKKIAGGELSLSPMIGKEIAVILLLLEDAAAGSASTELDGQASLEIKRLSAALEGDGASIDSLPAPKITGMASGESDEEARAQAIREILASLRGAEDILEGAFSFDEERELLVDAIPAINSAASVAKLVGAQKASEALAMVSRILASCRGREPSASERDLVAAGLAGSSMYFTALSHGENADEVIDPAWKMLAESESKGIGEPAGNGGAALSFERDVSAQAAGAGDAGGLDIPDDADLAEIYVEEGREIFENIDAALEDLGRDPSSKDALISLRRAFHTLKGSGRMVGLSRMGDAGQVIEDCLANWISTGRPATARLLSLAKMARGRFEEWVEALAAEGRAWVESSSWAKMAAGVELVAEELVAEELVAEELVAEELVAEELVAEELVAEELVAVVAEQRAVAPMAAPNAPARSDLMFSIFVDEAQGRAAAINAAIEAMGNGAASEELLRESHAMASIGHVAGFPEVSHSGAALEAWAMDPPGDELGRISEIALAADAGRELAAMVADIALGRSHRPGEFSGLLMDALSERRQARSLVPLGEPHAADVDWTGAIARAIGGIGAIREHLAQLQEGLAALAASGEGGESLKKKLMELAGPGDPDEALSALVSGWLANIQKSLAPVRGAFAADLPSEPMARLAAQAAESVAWGRPIASAGLPEIRAHEPAWGEAAPAPQPQLLLPLASPKPAGSASPANAERDGMDDALASIFQEEAEELVPQIAIFIRQLREGSESSGPMAGLLRALHTLKGSARMAGAARVGTIAHDMETLLESVAAGGVELRDACKCLDAANDSISEQIDALGHSLAGASPARVDSGAPAQSIRVATELIDRLVSEAGEVRISGTALLGSTEVLGEAVGNLGREAKDLARILRELEIESEASGSSTRAAQADPRKLGQFSRTQELARMLSDGMHGIMDAQAAMERAIRGQRQAIAEQEKMSADIQQSLMGIRLVKFSSIAERLLKVARQSAAELGKEADLGIAGGAVEVDRGVLERMAGPLEHLLRNSVAHGIEDAEKRRAAGKPAAGSIKLEVSHEGSFVRIDVQDDGGGLDLEKVRAKAMERGLLELGEEAGEQRLLDMIFQPGFSTAAAVSEIAGRGVGMDVVKSEVLSLGGRLEASTAAGKGMRYGIVLPVSLATAHAVLVEAGGQTFAIPAEMVDMVNSFKPAAMAEIRSSGLVREGGREYPYAYLPWLMGEPPSEPRVQPYAALVMVASAQGSLAIHVDKLIGTREIVVKKTGLQIARISGISGATVMGDGRLALIVNPIYLAERLSAGSSRQEDAPRAAGRLLVMVVDDSSTIRRATSKMLERLGYDVMTAYDGKDALDALKKRRPDIILSDVEMPRMDGFELLKKLKADAGSKAIPVVMITSRTAGQHQAEGMSLGASAYLGKPYQQEELLARIKELVVAEPSLA